MTYLVVSLDRISTEGIPASRANFSIPPAGSIPAVPTPAQCAWAAGFIDGEGCIFINKNSIRVDAKGCFNPLEFRKKIVDIWGGKALPHPCQSKHKPQMRWSLYGDNARRFLVDIVSYMGEKQDQAVLALHYRSLQTSGLPRDVMKEQKISIDRELRHRKRTRYNYHALASGSGLAAPNRM